MSEREDADETTTAPEGPRTPSTRVGALDTDSRVATLPGTALGRGRAMTQIECTECGRANPGDARFCAGCGTRFGREDHGDHDGGADPLLGRILADRYRIEELLGRGGMGVVYRVEHIRIAKLMAMKLLHGALAREKEVVKRFKREAEAVSRLDHPNTVQVFDFGQSEGMTYLVMEYLPGRDLGALVKEEGALPFARVARIATQVCGSVQQAHELGIVHRDLKPENIMVLEDRTMADFVKVLDFGLAKLREQEEMGEKSITRAGSILGTPYYMAPEHIRGETVDARSDVYAMGALIYKAVTGVPPFWSTTPVGVLTMHLTEDVVPPSERDGAKDVPPEADAIVLKAMSKNPRDRYQSMEALRADLLAYLAAVGEAEGLESGKLLRVGGVVPSQSGRQREVATRGDVDDFERRLRRRSLIGYALAAAILVAAGTAAAWVWRNRPVEQVTIETEPNDTLVTADVLPEEVPFTAHLGRRLDEQRSDADVYLLRNPGGARRVVRIEVTSIPNMDVTFEVYRAGISNPVLSADSGGIGEPEIVPNFVIDGPTYYLRVRELWESGRLPTENVSDPYTIRWRFVEPAEDEEREVNDSLELAEPIRVGESRRGYVGWGGDEDAYCLADDATDVVARLEAVPSLDLVLERVERISGRVRRFDENGVGQGERTDAVARAQAGALCFEVSARRPKEGLGNDPDDAYVLRIEHGSGDADEIPSEAEEGAADE